MVRTAKSAPYLGNVGLNSMRKPKYLEKKSFFSVSYLRSISTDLVLFAMNFATTMYSSLQFRTV